MSLAETPGSSFEQTFPLGADGRVEVNQGRGRLMVTGWDRSEVRLVARGNGVTDVRRCLRIESQSDRFKLAVEHERGWFLGMFTLCVDLELQVPATARLDLDTGSGSTTLSGVHGPTRLDCGSGGVEVSDVGPLELDAGSGDLTVRQVYGQLSVDSGSGRVQISDVQGNVRLDSGSGPIRIDRVQGDLHLDGGSGSVVVSDLTGNHAQVEVGSGTVQLLKLNVRRLEADSGSGHFTLELSSVAPGSRYQLDCGSGGLNVLLPPEAGLTVQVEGRRWSVDSALPLQTHVADDDLEGTMNGGGASLEIEAGGPVRLLPLGAGTPAGLPLPPLPAMPPLPTFGDAPAAAAPAASEEVKRVLEMVEQGKLSPEQADEILRALEEGNEPE